VPDVITNVSQVTPEWLTKTLQKQNFADWAHEISVQTVTCMHRTSTWFADIAFLEVSYFGKETSQAPELLILKISKSDLKSANWLYGKKEVEFYNRIAKEMYDLPLVCCYDAVYLPDSGNSHILLRDLSKTHWQPPHPLPPSRLACELAIDALAQFHVHWWEHPQLTKDLRKLSFSKLNHLGFRSNRSHPRVNTDREAAHCRVHRIGLTSALGASNLRRLRFYWASKKQDFCLQLFLAVVCVNFCYRANVLKNTNQI
jgi:hypothetical protein